jgi:hypothetical protein
MKRPATDGEFLTSLAIETFDNARMLFERLPEAGKISAQLRSLATELMQLRYSLEYQQEQRVQSVMARVPAKVLKFNREEN